MRLLRAELHKLNRPLFWCAVLGFALFTAVLALSAASNARQDANPGPVPGCAQLGTATPGACAAAQQAARARQAQTLPARLAVQAHTAAQLQPQAAGAESAGLMASLPGALLAALLAAGHVGGEWSGRTLKSLLTQCGRRHRVLLAKAVSLWLALAATTVAGWAVLAAVGPPAARLGHLPAVHQPLGGTLLHSAGQLGRALVVLALFSALAVLLAVATRSTVGTLGSAAGAVVALLAGASLPGVGRWTPATWVQHWMGFDAGPGALTTLPDNFWSRFLDPAGGVPGPTATAVEGCALAALAAALLVCAAAVFRTHDVTV